MLHPLVLLNYHISDQTFDWTKRPSVVGSLDAPHVFKGYVLPHHVIEPVPHHLHVSALVPPPPWATGATDLKCLHTKHGKAGAAHNRKRRPSALEFRKLQTVRPTSLLVHLHIEDLKAPTIEAQSGASFIQRGGCQRWSTGQEQSDCQPSEESGSGWHRVKRAVSAARASAVALLGSPT